MVSVPFLHADRARLAQAGRQPEVGWVWTEGYARVHQSAALISTCLSSAACFRLAETSFK